MRRRRRITTVVFVYVSLQLPAKRHYALLRDTLCSVSIVVVVVVFIVWETLQTSVVIIIIIH